MTTLRTYPSVALDECTHDFISTFLSHVASLAGYGQARNATITRVKTLLLAALEQRGDASETAWSMLYWTITEIVATANDAPEIRRGRADLRSFLEENVDLAAYVRWTAGRHADGSVSVRLSGFR